MGYSHKTQRPCQNLLGFVVILLRTCQLHRQLVGVVQFNVDAQNWHLPNHKSKLIKCFCQVRRELLLSPIQTFLFFLSGQSMDM